MPLTGTNTKVELAQPKNFLASKTIWGGLIAAASAIVPVLTGGEVTTEDVQQVGAGVEQIIQIGGGLLGFILVLWGRFSKKAQPVVIGSTANPVPVAITKPGAGS